MKDSSRQIEAFREGVWLKVGLRVRTIREIGRACVLASVPVALRGETPSPIILRSSAVRGHFFCTFSGRRRVRPIQLDPSARVQGAVFGTLAPNDSQGPLSNAAAFRPQVAPLSQDLLACSNPRENFLNSPVVPREKKTVM